MSKGTLFHECPLTHYLYFLYMDSKSGGKKKLYYWYQRDTCHPPSPVQHRASLAPSSCILLPNPMLCLEVVLLEYVNFHTRQFHFLLEQWKQSINQYWLLCQNPWSTHHMAFVLWLAQINAGPLQPGGDDQSYLPSFVPCDCFLLLLSLVWEQVERAEESGLEQQHFWTWQIWLCTVLYWSCKLPSSTCPSCKP